MLSVMATSMPIRKISSRSGAHAARPQAATTSTRPCGRCSSTTTTRSSCIPTHFEYDDLYAAYGHHWLQRAEPVIPPLGESLPNTEIFRRLATRFGFTDSCFAASDKELMDDAVDAADPRMQGIKGSEVSPFAALRMMAPDGRSFALFDNIRPGTPSGKVELASDVLAQRWGAHAPLPAYRQPAVTSLQVAPLSTASGKPISP